MLQLLYPNLLKGYGFIELKKKNFLSLSKTKMTLQTTCACVFGLQPVHQRLHHVASF